MTLTFNTPVKVASQALASLALAAVISGGAADKANAQDTSYKANTGPVYTFVDDGVTSPTGPNDPKCDSDEFEDSPICDPTTPVEPEPPVSEPPVITVNGGDQNFEGTQTFDGTVTGTVNGTNTISGVSGGSVGNVSGGTLETGDIGSTSSVGNVGSTSGVEIGEVRTGPSTSGVEGSGNSNVEFENSAGVDGSGNSRNTNTAGGAEVEFANENASTATIAEGAVQVGGPEIDLSDRSVNTSVRTTTFEDVAELPPAYLTSVLQALPTTDQAALVALCTGQGANSFSAGGSDGRASGVLALAFGRKKGAASRVDDKSNTSEAEMARTAEAVCDRVIGGQQVNRQIRLTQETVKAETAGIAAINFHGRVLGTGQMDKACEVTTAISGNMFPGLRDLDCAGGEEPPVTNRGTTRRVTVPATSLSGGVPEKPFTTYEFRCAADAKFRPDEVITFTSGDVENAGYSLSDPSAARNYALGICN